VVEAPPLVIRWPDSALNGQVREDTVSIMDIAPTLLEAAGVEN
jgi:arylsulfatase A-like enzyme